MTVAPKAQPNPEVSDLDPDSMAAIRSLLAAEPAPKARKRKSAEPEPVPAAQAEPVGSADRFTPIIEDAPAEAVPQAAGKSLGFGFLKRKRAAMPPRTPEPVTAHQPAGDGFVARLIDPIKAKVLGYRPTPKHIFWAALVLLVLFRPWLVAAFVVLTVLVITAVFLILGYDGFWRRAMGVARWYARRHPSRSVELHRKLDDFAVKFDEFLDRFPEGSVDGLYLPDFGDIAEAEARHEEAMGRRLESLRETGA